MSWLMCFATIPHSPTTESSTTSWSYFRWLHERLPEPFFQTEAFLIFFALVAGVYWLLPRRWNMLRVTWLVIASFHFYAAWSSELAFLVTGTTIVDYCLARLMDRCQGKKSRLAWLLASLSMNLGLLFYFKYKNFFLDSLNDMLLSAGVPGSFDTLKIIIPFGISFYTFEAISYAVDVYRRKIPAEKNLLHFMLFILFFPHLVAGPIVRGGDFLRQARRIKRWNWIRVQYGVQLFLIGVFKKLAIADRMAIFSDDVLQNPTYYNSSAVWLAVLAFSIRIYADFSAYSDMALGLAHLLGFRLTKNFNMPYLAVNVTDFWRRWHISLSTWLRDYVFIPLGGSRGSRWFNYRNLLITMLLGGLWHGAAWSYVIWGLLHGIFLIVHKQFQLLTADMPRYRAFLESSLGTVGRVLLTFLCVTLAWVFFRPDLHGAWDVLQRLFWIQPGLPVQLNNRSLWYTVLFVLVCHLLVNHGIWQKVWAKLPPPAMGVSYAITLMVAMLLAPPTSKLFIYFTF